jgi:hypothetical protein
MLRLLLLIGSSPQSWVHAGSPPWRYLGMPVYVPLHHFVQGPRVWCCTLRGSYQRFTKFAPRDKVKHRDAPSGCYTREASPRQCVLSGGDECIVQAVHRRRIRLRLRLENFFDLRRLRARQCARRCP